MRIDYSQPRLSVQKSKITKKIILDACCGSKMFWFDKENPLVDFMDIRSEHHTLCDGRSLTIEPDIIADFTNMPFEDSTYKLVVFDPPHLIHAGKESYLRKKYGCLDKDTWKDVLKSGFSECFRVLDDYGVLVFKWNETQVKVSEVLKLTNHSPLFGQRRNGGKTIWIAFMKLPTNINQ